MFNESNERTFVVSIVFGTVLLFFILTCKVIFDFVIQQSISINKHDIFLYSSEWDNDNPFETIKIDTVKVLEIDRGYIKYKRLNNDYNESTKLWFFKRNIRQLNLNNKKGRTR